MNAIDTNVLVYAVDADGKDKRVQALALLNRLPPAETLILWRVVCEFGSVLTKFAVQGRQGAEPADAVAAVRGRYPVALPSEQLVGEALRLRQVHQMSYWDALLLAGCIDAGVDRLYTEDIQGSPVIEESRSSIRLPDGPNAVR